MLNAFGRLASELRVERGITQKTFSELTGMSLSRISNLEHQRSAISDEVLDAYVAALKINSAEEADLRKLASFSNKVRLAPTQDEELSPLFAMLQQFGSRLSAGAVQQIRDILEAETNEKIASLRFSSNLHLSVRKKSLKSKNGRRPELQKTRFVEIALLAEQVRNLICGETSKLDIGLALEKLRLRERHLDFEVVEHVPPEMEGAFGAIYGGPSGHKIVLEELSFRRAMSGVYFLRHVIAHEIGHHFLHPHLLESSSDLVLKPQELAKNRPENLGTEKMIHQVIDTVEEVEAECFATMFLVPWTAFLKGTEVNYLAADYGEQLDEVKRYAAFLRLAGVRDEFRRCLWEKDIKKHPIFDVLP